MRYTAWLRGVFGVCLAFESCVGTLSGLESGWCDQTRTAQVAGSFYPAQRRQLLETVQGLLDIQKDPALSEKPRVLILPHAGYPYSGAVAASGLHQIQGRSYDGVVVVGFTHHISFSGSSVDHVDAYETPLGRIPVDKEAVSFLEAQNPSIRYQESVHSSGEHSLEVLLPYFQVALGEFRLVPVLMGSSDWQDASALAEALARLAQRGDYLFVFSTDLSHYHEDSQAREIDQRTVDAILSETSQALHRLFEQGRLEACGRGPILTSLLFAEHLGYLKRQLLRYANSADATQDRSRVVGYAAIAMISHPTPRSVWLSNEAGMVLVREARQILERSLGSHNPPASVSVNNPAIGPQPSAVGPVGLLKRTDGWDVAPLEADLPVPQVHPVGLHTETGQEQWGLHYPELAQAHGMFVTLRREGKLRGCIGRIETQEPLASILSKVVLEAALEDPRFAPVQADELETLHIEVSVLTPPQPLARLEDLVAGRDGVILEYAGRRGVFLPQVWQETAWTRVEFLEELASQKAGLKPDAWKDARLFVFQDQVFAEPLSESSEAEALDLELPASVSGSAH